MIFEIPSSATLQNKSFNRASILVDHENQTIGLYEKEFRIPIDKDSINPDIIKALVNTEDIRFYDHCGIDFKALSRVLIKTILLQKKESGGGSTITQQLAKQLYPRPISKNKFFGFFSLLKSKLKEWIIAIKLENIYSKKEILALYLNKFEFINGAHGIEAASLTYFNKNQSKLNYNEIATLVGMLKNPSLYNPIRFPEKTRKRRNEVLEKMSLAMKFDPSQFVNLPLDMSKFKRKEYPIGPLPYFKNSMIPVIQKLILDHQIKNENGDLLDIYNDGLVIETSIDQRLQKLIEQSSLEHMEWLQNWFNKSWKNKDPWTFQADSVQLKFRKDVFLQKVMSSNRYQNLKLNFSGARLNNEFKKQFNQKVKMKIFDHKNGEKEVEMTPMDSVRFHNNLLQNAMVVLDPKNGNVLAWHGGLGFQYFKFDHGTPRKSIGSTMKPFLYTVAMTEGKVKPSNTYKDTAYVIEPFESNFLNKERWAPHNATEIYTTLDYNLYHGLLYSKNSITVKLLKDLGTIDGLVNLLDKVGIDKDEKLANGRLAVPRLPSIALGAVDITLLQLTSAFSTFANNGVHVDPVLIKSIKNKQGKIIYQAKTKATKAIDPLYNAVMVDMLKNVVGGEFSMKLKTENGGKTGTTNDQSDGWFVGITPNLVAGVWTGGEEKWIRFTKVDIGQGYFTARPVFEKFMKKLEKDTSIYNSKVRFSLPPPGFKELTNCSKVKTEKLPEFLRPKIKIDTSKSVAVEVKKDSSQNLPKPKISLFK
jgi:penicillin-binding protein 1A